MVLVDVCDTLIINVKPTECPLRLVLLDVGIVAQLSEIDKENFTEVFRAVVLGEVCSCCISVWPRMDANCQL